FLSDPFALYVAAAISLRGRSKPGTVGSGSGGALRSPVHREQTFGGRYYGPYRGFAAFDGRIRPNPLSRGDPAVPHAGTAGRIHAGPALARAWRPPPGAQPRHPPFAPAPH